MTDADDRYIEAAETLAEALLTHGAETVNDLFDGRPMTAAEMAKLRTAVHVIAVDEGAGS